MRLWGALRDVLLALLSSLLLVASFPKANLGFLGWVALVPLFIALKGKDYKWSFGLSFLMGIIFLMGVFYWINAVEGVQPTDFLLLGVYLGSYFGLFGLALNLVTQRTKITFGFAAPVLWVSMEYARSNAGFLGLPWGLVGYTQFQNLPVVQLASITGVYGVTFLVVLVNAALSETLHKFQQGLKPFLIAFFALATIVSYGLFLLSDSNSPSSVRIAIIQGNIPQRLKWKPEWWKDHFEKYIRLTREAAHENNTALIVWPEGSIPGALTQELYLLSALTALSKDINTHLLVGSSVRPNVGSRDLKRTHWHNSAFLLSPQQGIVDRYNKIHLLPFAEYLPYANYLSWPNRLTSGDWRFLQGEKFTIFAVNGVKFGVLICWENIFPDLVRRFVKTGATFLVNITNEAWFGDSSAPYQILAMNVFRAVENRRSVARSANTGISCLIDPYGRILAKVEDSNGKAVFIDGYVTGNIPLSYEKTFYTTYGDVWAYLNLMAAATMVLVSLHGRRR